MLKNGGVKLGWRGRDILYKKQNGGLILVLRFYSPIFQHWGGVSVEKSHHGIIFSPLTW
jgi:hypothetical protein